MSGINHLLDEIDPILLADHPENVALWLPSHLPSSSRISWCAPGLPYIEYRLRYAIATNAIQDMRRFLRFSQAINIKTRSHISNTQRTRTRGQKDRVWERVTQAAATYRASWSALHKLAPNEEFGPWKKLLQELHKDDIRGPAREDYETSQSCYIPSWIWQTVLQTSEFGDEDFHAALRVEWCKAQERAARYEEEIELVVEEMRRTLVFFEWLTHEWEQRATHSPGATNTLIANGISAYAHKQAAVYRTLVKVFVDDWHGCLTSKSLGSSWLEKYSTPPTVKRHRLVSNVQLYHSSPPPSDGAELEPDPDVDDAMELFSYDDTSEFTDD